MRDIVEARKIIAERKETAERALADLRAELFRDDDFADDCHRLSYLDFQLAKCTVYGTPDGGLQAERDALQQKINEYLKNKGISDIDTPEYSCKKCHDTGYADGARCECLEAARREVDLARNPDLNGVPDGLKKIDFSFYGERAADYTKYAKFLYQNFVNGELNFVTIIGATGTGKTYLAETCLKQMLYDGCYVEIINAVKLNRKFLEYHCAPLERKADVWADLIAPDVLLIDDMGVEATINNVTLQYFYELLTERANLKTILTSNLDLRGIENKYQQRIMSRLADKRKSAIISVGKGDYRI